VNVFGEISGFALYLKKVKYYLAKEEMDEIYREMEANHLSKFYKFLGIRFYKP